MTRRALLAGGAATLLCALRQPAFAQAFPGKPLRLIVPFPAGGDTDAMTRTRGDALSRDLGQPIKAQSIKLE